METHENNLPENNLLNIYTFITALAINTKSNVAIRTNYSFESIITIEICNYESNLCLREELTLTTLEDIYDYRILINNITDKWWELVRRRQKK